MRDQMEGCRACRRCPVRGTGQGRHRCLREMRFAGSLDAPQGAAGIRGRLAMIRAHEKRDPEIEGR
jgi:hypothetical protein